MAARTTRDNRVGSLFPLLAILSCGAVIFAIIPLAIGEPNYAIPAGVLFAVLVSLTVTDSIMARHQAHIEPARGATEQDGSLPLMTVEITDPFGDGDHSHALGLHDFPPGHPARRALRETSTRSQP